MEETAGLPVCPDPSGGYVFLNFCLLPAYRIRLEPTVPKLPIAIFKLQAAELPIQHQAAFTLQVSP